MPTNLQFSRFLAMRMRDGDRVLAELSTANALAKALGASRKAAGRVIALLVDKNVLNRIPHSRPTINRTHSRLPARTQLALLSPAYDSAIVDRVRLSFGATFRPIDFVRLDDPFIRKAIARFDTVFFVPNSRTRPRVAAEHLQRAKHSICLDADLSSHWVLSLNLLPPRFMHHLGDQLSFLGRIDFNAYRSAKRTIVNRAIRCVIA